MPRAADSCSQCSRSEMALVANLKKPAKVRAVVDDGGKLQVDFGNEETALVKASQVN